MNEKIRHSVLKLIRYLFVTILILGLTFILGSFVITFFYGEEVQRYVTTGINEQLNAKLTVADMKL